jgi:DNA-binding NtrC family response regulator
VLVVDDDELIVSVLSRALRNEGYDVRSETAAAKVLDTVKMWQPGAVLLDIRLPEGNGIAVLEDIVGEGLRTQVIMLTADDTAETAVKAMKLGAADYLTKPFNIDEVKIVVRNTIERESLSREVDYLRKVNEDRFDRPITGVSDAIRSLKAEGEKIAKARVSSILITGESGTGKELIARYLHRLMFADAAPHRMPFIGVNCAALPETMLESELFGHERGAFTDAKADKKGIFELADGGVILLDEIGEMLPSLQARLLRVLEERSVRRLGGKEDIAVDVTVIATTNRNLAEAVRLGEFRQDLFFRLSNFYLFVPPLRERSDDIPVLTAHFLDYFAARYNKKTVKRFSPEAQQIIVSYHWPGNVRELRNLVERIVVLESAEVVLPSHLPEWMTGAPAKPAAPCRAGGVKLPENGISLDDVERDLIRQALERTRNNKTQAAKLLGISYDTLRYQAEKFGIEQGRRRASRRSMPL